MLLKPGTKLGPYEILASIGVGGMGEVYRARDGRLAREVAIKILPPAFQNDPERLRRFEQEGRATGQLNHPNIMAIYDTGSHAGIHYVVEELLEGETLRQRLSGSPLAARKAIDFARQIARGLAAAHHKGIVHRDLKPENLFITTGGRIKILDFGLAKLTVAELAGPEMTSAPTRVETGAGVVMGTVGYMSPEQVRGEAADPRSDIFSLGSILYEMLTGQQAFRGDSSVETMNAILKEEPPEISGVNRDVPPGIDRIVQHCLEKRPGERFQSASDLAFQIEALSGTSAPSGPSHPAVRAARPGRLRRLLMAAGFLILLAAAFSAGREAGRLKLSPTYEQLTFRQGSLFSARFTPDAQTIVYSAGWDGNRTELYSTRPGSRGSRALEVEGAEILAIADSGEMAILLDPSFTVGWMRSGTLARMPLTGGAPRRVLENVQDADWSPDGTRLAVARTIEGRYRLEYPIGTVLFETEGWISWPRFSRDGDSIAFLHHPRGGDDRGEVMTVDLEGNIDRLTDPFASAAGLGWSPSGNEVWFTASRNGTVRALYAVDRAGNERLVESAPADLTLQDVSSGGEILMTHNNRRRGVIVLAPGEQDERDLSWLDWTRPGTLSPDGRWLLFDEEGQGGGPNYSVYIRRTDGSPPVHLGEGSTCSLSPDGLWAMTSSLSQPELLVMLPRGPGEPKRLEFPGMKMGCAGWLPDSETLWLHASQGGRPYRVFIVDSEGATPRPITPEGITLGIRLSPDGRFVIAIGTDRIARFYPVGEGEPRTIPGIERGEIVVGWSEDGGSVYVIRKGELPVTIQRLDLSSGRKTFYKELMPDNRTGLIDIDFVNLAAGGLAHSYSYRRFLSTLFLVDGVR